MSTTTVEYIGEELELFKVAHNWKQYYRNIILPYLKGEVLEVGAGIGATTEHLVNRNVTSWTCLEPDPLLAQKITAALHSGKLPAQCKLLIGTTDDLKTDKLYDAIIYIDVIEHIENDTAELRRSQDLLKPGGHLIILVPAHNWLFSPFDMAIGHFRRYNKSMLNTSVPATLKKVRLSYLDCVGLMLRKAYPTEKQIRFWDTMMVPFSKIIDPLFGFRVGKSVLGIWQKPA
jgi:2-polyprenyl-3-methyl-5-hydroxy-6-metoxy-1,4-benzoquinol methylase